MIRELKTLVVVAREGTFAAAGHRVGLTQAAVSAQMQRLEAELGFALFDREGRTARLNARGEHLLVQAQEILRLYGNLSSVAVDPAVTARVVIGAIASVQRSMLPDALAAFYHAHPNVHTRVIPGVSMELVNRVDAGEIDLAVVIEPPFALQGDLHWRALAHEPFRLIVPRGMPRKAGTHGSDWQTLLATQPFIRYDRASFGGRIVDRFLRRLPLPVRDVAELDELEAIVRLVENGVGVALVPQTAIYRRWPEQVRAIDLGDDTFYRNIGVVHRDPRQMTEAARTVLALIEREARKAAPARSRKRSSEKPA